MNICIIGGGNIGTAMAADIAGRKKHKVTVYTSRSDMWQSSIEAIDMATGEGYISELANVTSDIKEAVSDADIVFITVPSFKVEEIFHQISPHLKRAASVGVIPGTGGAEFYCNRLVSEGHIFFGPDRVPCVARVKEYGKSVNISKKESVRLAAIPRKYTDMMCDRIAEVLDMECKPLSNYLVVTLTPSNPIMHTARLYTMFKNYVDGMTWDYNIPFYGEWDDEASAMLLACDDELQCLCRKINGLDLSGVIPLKKHYESETIEQLTAKIRSIVSLRNISSPMLQIDNRYIPDMQSRYFTEDMPFGLCIIKGFCIIAKVDTPNIDRILDWYGKISGREYFIGNDYSGTDIHEAVLPQFYGIHTVDDIVRFYSL